MAKKNISTDTEALAALKTTIGIADPVLSYAKGDVDTLLLAKADVGDSYGKADTDAKLLNPYWLATLKLLGTSMKVVPAGFGLANVLANTLALTNGTINYLVFYAPEPETVTGVKYCLNVAGNYTADAAKYNGYVVYSLASDGAMVEITRTENDGNVFKNTAYSLGTKAFPSPVVIPAGFVVVAQQWNASAVTTAPTAYTWGFLAGLHELVLSTGKKLAGTQTGQTTPPASINLSAITASNQVPFSYLY